MCKTLLCVLCMLLLRRDECRSQRATVYLIPTLHGLHKTNLKYTYDSLRRVIDHLKPDMIAVEIRPFDVALDSAYLSKNYPLEMWMMRYWFPGKQIVGFDWLGDDIEGKKIPAGYWRSVSPVKKYERALDEDSIFAVKSNVCDSISKRRMEILRNQSLREILRSDDAKLTKAYYTCLSNQLKGSVHTKLLDFYATRNRKMVANLNRLFKMEAGKTIVVLTGDDHYPFLRDSIAPAKIFGKHKENTR